MTVSIIASFLPCSVYLQSHQLEFPNLLGQGETFGGFIEHFRTGTSSLKSVSLGKYLLASDQLFANAYRTKELCLS